MKVILIVVLCIAAAWVDGEQATPDKSQFSNIQIVESTFENDGAGTYDFTYKGSDGSARQEHGVLRSLGEKEPKEVVVVTGEYSWTSPEGKEFTVKFIADDKGYRVVP